MIADARIRSKKIRRAVSVAAFGGWSLAVFAALSFVFALFGDRLSLLAGLALTVTAVNEFRGAERLRRYDASAARLLGYNQIALGIMILLYSGWMIYSMSGGKGVAGLLPAPDPSAGREVNEMLQGYTDSLAPLVTLFYIIVGLVGALVPGLTALYYFSRGPIVRRFREATPAWVIDAINASQ